MDHPCIISDVVPCGKCIWCASARRQGDVFEDWDIEGTEQILDKGSNQSRKDNQCQD